VSTTTTEIGVLTDQEHWVELNTRLSDLAYEVQMRSVLFGDADHLVYLLDRIIYIQAISDAIYLKRPTYYARLVTFFKVLREDMSDLSDPSLMQASKIIHTACIEGVDSAIGLL